MSDESGPPEPPQPRGGALAGVLADLSRLRARVEAVEAENGLSERVEDLAGRVEAIDEALDDLGRRQKAAKPAPAWWPGLPDDDQDELAQRWGDFTAWLRDVLAVRYIEDARKLSWCWSRHPVAVDALTSLWLTWQAAYLDPSADARDAADWQTRWRRDLIEIAAEELGDCRMKSTGGQRIHVERDDLSGDLLASLEPVRDTTS